MRGEERVGRGKGLIRGFRQSGLVRRLDRGDREQTRTEVMEARGAGPRRSGQFASPGAWPTSYTGPRRAYTHSDEVRKIVCGARRKRGEADAAEAGR